MEWCTPSTLSFLSLYTTTPSTGISNTRKKEYSPLPPYQWRNYWFKTSQFSASSAQYQKLKVPVTWGVSDSNNWRLWVFECAYGLVLAPPDFSWYFPQKILSHLIIYQAPSFKMEFEWFHFMFTDNQQGTYNVPKKMSLYQNSVVEGRRLFPHIMTFLQLQFGEAYTNTDVAHIFKIGTPIPPSPVPETPI